MLSEHCSISTGFTCTSTHSQKRQSRPLPRLLATSPNTRYRDSIMFCPFFRSDWTNRHQFVKVFGIKSTTKKLYLTCRLVLLISVNIVCLEKMLLINAGEKITKDKAQIKAFESCALLFFGLMKSFENIVLPSIQENILGPNPSCDVFLHTYNFTCVPSNPRNNEGKCDEKYQSSEAYLLTPHVVIEDLDTFEMKRKNHTVVVNEHHHRNWGPCCLSSENMVKQWHSIESVWELMESFSAEKNVFYNRVGLFRSDVYYVDPINISDSQAALPSFGSWNGVNDRLFYGSYDHARVWATKRFEFIPSFLKHFLKTNNNGHALLHLNGSYDVRSAQAYLQHGGYQGFHSETFLAKLLLNYSVLFETKAICLRRVRAKGIIESSDC